MFIEFLVMRHHHCIEFVFARSGEPVPRTCRTPNRCFTLVGKTCLILLLDAYPERSFCIVIRPVTIFTIAALLRVRAPAHVQTRQAITVVPARVLILNHRVTTVRQVGALITRVAVCKLLNAAPHVLCMARWEVMQRAGVHITLLAIREHRTAFTAELDVR